MAEGSYTVSRRIEIDAGHRIRLHGSKCRNLHGHRYRIEAICTATELHADGEQAGMAIDFGFLKEEMIAAIDTPCDHGFIAEIDDNDLLALFCPAEEDQAQFRDQLRYDVVENGYAATTRTALDTRLYVIDRPPTAENLARHWFERLAPAVSVRSSGFAELISVRVWETPNCVAEWHARAE